MSKSGIVTTKDMVGAFRKTLGTLMSKDVLVGIPSTAAGRQEPGDPANNALIGYVMENGSPAKNIPARPHLIPGIQDSQELTIPRLRKAAEAALQNKPEEMERQLHAAGMLASNAVKAKINSNIPPKLADSTLAARKRRGVSRENTLVDTGQYRNAITYVVRQK